MAFKLGYHGYVGEGGIFCADDTTKPHFCPHNSDATDTIHERQV
jgi:hypothetical protein